jgi:hypothetical protein
MDLSWNYAAEAQAYDRSAPPITMIANLQLIFNNF